MDCPAKDFTLEWASHDLTQYLQIVLGAHFEASRAEPGLVMTKSTALRWERAAASAMSNTTTD